jgi:hypothetical protein
MTARSSGSSTCSRRAWSSGGSGAGRLAGRLGAGSGRGGSNERTRKCRARMSRRTILSRLSICSDKKESSCAHTADATHTVSVPSRTDPGLARSAMRWPIAARQWSGAIETRAARAVTFWVFASTSTRASGEAFGSRGVRCRRRLSVTEPAAKCTSLELQGSTRNENGIG